MRCRGGELSEGIVGRIRVENYSLVDVECRVRLSREVGENTRWRIFRAGSNQKIFGRF